MPQTNLFTLTKILAKYIQVNVNDLHQVTGKIKTFLMRDVRQVMHFHMQKKINYLPIIYTYITFIYSILFVILSEGVLKVFIILKPQLTKYQTSKYIISIFFNHKLNF